MRCGATVGDAVAAGFGDGDAETVGTTITGVRGAATQSIGWTTVTPVSESYEMTRTFDSAAHASSVAASVGVIVSW